MSYKENPKTKGSGILCCISQSSKCPNGCSDCFFNSGRSYLSPLEDNLPNMPAPRPDRVFRINDGNDSNIDREKVIAATVQYQMKFFNTAIPRDLAGFPGPVVLTANPGAMTDRDFHRIDPIPKNLMAARIRVNMWNLESVVDPAVAHFAERNVPLWKASPNIMSRGRGR